MHLRVEIEASETKESDIEVAIAPTDFLVLKGNAVGEDELLPDIHAVHELLQQKISSLKPDDRLVIVGDLFDRGFDKKGTDSFKVYDAIMEANKGLPPDKQKVYCVRGNHEDVLVDYYDLFMKQRQNPQKYKEEYDQLKALLLSQGGEWATVLESERPGDQEKIKKLNDIVAYLKTLPYVIVVDEVKQHKITNKPVEGYVVVHADLPFPQQELFRRIKDKMLMFKDEFEKHHATNARPTSKEVFPETLDKFFPKWRTYCGHSVGRGVRINRRHYNFDGGAFCTHALLTINHHQNTCDLLGVMSEKARLYKLQMNPLELRDQIDYFFKTEKIIGICHDFLETLPKKSGKIKILQEMLNLLIRGELDDSLNVLKKVSNILDKNINLLTKKSAPHDPKHDAHVHLLLTTINQSMREQTEIKVEKKAEKKSEKDSAAYEKLKQDIKTKLQVLDIFDTNLHFLEEFTKKLDAIGDTRESDEVKFQKTQALCIDTYCYTRQSQEPSLEKMADVLLKLIEKQICLSLPKAIDYPVYTGYVQSKKMNFKQSCYNLTNNLKKLFPELELKETAKPNEAELMKLLKIAIEQRLKTQPGGLFSNKKGDPQKYAELNRMLEQYHVILHPNIKKTDVINIADVYTRPHLILKS